jgi:hypothetical protein
MRKTRDELIAEEMVKVKKVMSVPRIGLASVWFVSDQHRENFEKLLVVFPLAMKSPEHAAPCYVCGHPEIYSRINWAKSDGPVGWYWGEWIGKDDDDPNGYHAESGTVAGLSSAYRGLVRAVVEMYTGSQHHFDLMGWLGNAGDEVYKLFVQAMEIRRDRYVIDLYKEI